MYNLKNCPISKHEVHMFVYAGTCPEIRCVCGLTYSHCDMRAPETLADQWNTMIGESTEGDYITAPSGLSRIELLEEILAGGKVLQIAFDTSQHELVTAISKRLVALTKEL